MKQNRAPFVLVVLILLILSLACNLPIEIQQGGEEPDGPSEESLPADSETAEEPAGQAEPDVIFSEEPIGDGSLPAGALSPNDLVYRGAFRLPDDSGGMGWEYSGHGLTHYPAGDPGGAADGFPGSLYMVGHDQALTVAELTIPAPVISTSLEDLPAAETLQPLADISGGYITDDLAIPRMGIAYLAPMGAQPEGMLHFCIGQHIQDFEPSHGWTDLKLGEGGSAGLWVFDGFSNYTTNDYLFDVPEAWADQYAPEYRLATGRFREGVWGGLGPALYVYSPWEDGNPPPAGSALSAIQPLLLYGIQTAGNPEIQSDDTMMMDGYQPSDHWWGGAWLTSPAGDAVIFTGTKAVGESWYGFANGVVWPYDCADEDTPDCPEYPDFPFDDRGFWAMDYQGVVLFFDPVDLGRVAQGQMETFDPQPYGILDLTPYLYDPMINVEIYKRDLIGAAAFDRDSGLLYIIERLADEYKSVVHVFQTAP
jgi:hypothetical protein